MFTVQIAFHGDLPGFLPRDYRGMGVINRILAEKTAVKDVVEACGVPHPEVDLILAQESGSEPRPVDFAWQVQGDVSLDVHPVPAPDEVLRGQPHLQIRSATQFVADGHLGKLARNLRLLGLDTAYERDADDRRLLEIMAAENRALLTRDRRLLMHSVVRQGYCPRSSEPTAQTAEVIDRFALIGGATCLTPFCRCLRCNGLLEPVAKEDVLHSLATEPLTLRYYEEFRRCVQCRRIYWQGTHFDKLVRRVAVLLACSRHR